MNTFEKIAAKTREDDRLETAKKTKKKTVSATIEAFFVRNRDRFGYIQAGMLLLLLLLIVVPAFLPLPSEDAGIFNNFTLFARYVMWGIWFPLVFVSVIVFGRLWCGALCPQGAVSEYLSRWGLKRPVPSWLRKGYVPVLSFVVITIIGQVIGIRDYPLPAMEIFIITTLLAVLIGLLFSPQRRVWCRYLCPMGPLLGVFSRLGAVSFEKEGKGGRGYLCPTYIKTQTKSASSDCIECFKCVNPGESSSLHFRLRHPGREIEEIGKRAANIWEVIFIFAATGLALGAFYWQATLLYLRFKQGLGIFFTDLGLIDIVAKSGPKWLIVNYPEAGEVFIWLDLIGITTFMLMTMAGVAAILFIFTTLSALMLRKGEPITSTITKLGYLYAPVALVSLVLGMGQMLFGSLGEIGSKTGMFEPAFMKTVAGIFFAGGGLWSLYLAWKLQGRLSTAIIPAVLGVGMIAFLWHRVLF